VFAESVREPARGRRQGADLLLAGGATRAMWVQEYAAGIFVRVIRLWVDGIPSTALAKWRCSSFRGIRGLVNDHSRDHRCPLRAW
jgi:hypothetical protein